jgi:ABC-2 type transport system permease protein
MTATVANDRRATATFKTVGFGNLLRSEWTKLRSLRSTYWSGAFIVVATVGLAVFMGVRWARQIGSLPPRFDATNVSLSGVYLAQLVVGALGVLTISSEYTTGMIRATFSAVPQRRVLLAAKAAVLAGATLVLGEILAFVSFLICQALLVGKHAGVSLGDPGALRAVFGAGLYLTAIALLAFGLGAAIRHTAGALSAFFGILFAPSIFVALLPASLGNDIAAYLPGNSGSQVFTTLAAKDTLSPWAGLGVFCLYVLAALVGGFALVGARDA